MDWTEVRLVLTFLVMLFISWLMSKVGMAMVKRNPSFGESRVFHLWFVAFCVISLLDSHSTYMMIREFGVRIEGNPIPFFTLKYLGVIPGLIVRLTAGTAICYFVFRKYPEILVGLNVFYVFVPIWNYWLVYRSI